MRAYERLLNYVRIHTTSDEEADKQPTTERQFDLAHLLADEMRVLGLEQVRISETAYVYGFLPATPGYEKKPALGFIAHMDTSPNASGENVNPQVHEQYDGGDVALSAGTTGSVEQDNSSEQASPVVLTVDRFPHLAALKGRTLITTDGTTLLGAFTPDEEIGRGTDRFDVQKFGADFAFTLDGGELGELEYENFNAALATITIR